MNVLRMGESPCMVDGSDRAECLSKYSLLLPGSTQYIFSKKREEFFHGQSVEVVP
jgi:hypothetical protein